MRFHHSGPDDGEIPAQTYQLADHLDAALAAAEDLTDAGRQWVPATASAGYERAGQLAAERQVIERVRMFETMLIGRVLKARKRAQVLARSAGELAGMTRLFIGGTAPLLDAVEELGDSTHADFETGDCHIAYLRRRGVIAEDAADLPEDRAIRLGGDQFLVAGRIALAPLTAMIIAFLDALDMHYDLYPDEPSGAAPFDWPEIVNPARQGETLDNSSAHSDKVDAIAHDDGPMSDAADATAQNAEVSECKADDAVGASQTGDAAPSRERAPRTKVTAKSLVDRLDDIARAFE